MPVAPTPWKQTDPPRVQGSPTAAELTPNFERASQILLIGHAPARGSAAGPPQALRRCGVPPSLDARLVLRCLRASSMTSSVR